MAMSPRAENSLALFFYVSLFINYENRRRRDTAAPPESPFSHIINSPKESTFTV